jgi:hypothetical protein
MDDIVKKKRGRKPKNYTCEEVVVQVEKKKRGRKKKYEIENSDKILNKENINNFNHSIVYSDDDETTIPIDESKSSISFGNLNITVSRKANQETENFKNLFHSKNINEDEYSSEEEKEIPIEKIINFEKNYKENKRYMPNVLSETKETDCIKKIKVITTTKNVITNTEEWPESTDTCCWWCCHPFEGTPCTMPVKYDQHRKRFTFVGIFCSWNCVKAYNFDKNDYRMYERSSLITLLVQQLYGIVKAISIKSAPPRQTLKMFGGYKDITEFRECNGTTYHMNLVNFNYIYPEITEVTNIKLKTEKKNLRLTRS